MKAIDTFLQKQEVDVGKSFGLLSLTGSVFSVYGMLGQLFAGRIHFDLSAPIGVIVGVALWQHRSWSRTLLLVISWAVVVLVIAMLTAAPFIGTANMTLTVGATLIRNPPLWQLFIFAVFLAPVAWFTLAVLHSERAKVEFKKPNPPAELASPSRDSSS